MLGMYFAIISNDSYPGETDLSDIFFVKPSLRQLYDIFGNPDDMKSRFYTWTILVKQITNLKSIEHVSSLQYSEHGWDDDDYIIDGDGYLYEEHKTNSTTE